MRKFVAVFTALLFIACSQAPKPSLAEYRQNQNAPMAFFSPRGNLDDDMRLKYAIAMQKAGVFNFIAEDFSEEQIENAIEIRIDYSEKKIVFNSIPVLYLQVELLKDDLAVFKFTIREESELISNNLREKNREKALRQEVLLRRFIEELKRLDAEEKNSA